jgi:hypothetical protein
VREPASIYTAANAADALTALGAFEAQWGRRFPMVGKSWRAAGTRSPSSSSTRRRYVLWRDNSGAWNVSRFAQPAVANGGRDYMNPATLTGAQRFVVVPSPISLTRFSPQHDTSPVDDRAQEWTEPTAIA